MRETIETCSGCGEVAAEKESEVVPENSDGSVPSSRESYSCPQHEWMVIGFRLYNRNLEK